ncbi:cytochrome P450 [Aspergillus steynii IBT 23096]|uniref:Cytochrome P450 n=1 Tax=Aspergillus steynii IBT 23096 TaxID=1392250 RepID=A0A2I2GGG3_9EURO|nr:cytochrome P450 [Aspergillus steynii IBT 23096]PLB51973.1 cytochrome P450 [Aspergillus steynii IBT 23096]
MLGERMRGSQGSKFDYLSRLVESKKFTEKEAVPQIMTIMAAGYETAGSTLAWTIYCLAAHPGVQKALRQELHEHMAQESSSEGQNSQYDKLPLLNGVVMETARLYPAFPFLPRKTIEATTIGGRHVPAGVYIGICPIAINHARHLWGADADTFRPERWIDRSDPARPVQNPLGGSVAPVCMMSFGYGARSCVGRPLGLALIKRQVAVLVQRFQLEQASVLDQPSPEGLFAAGPPPGLQVRCTRISA